jgi:hypothetical protein
MPINTPCRSDWHSNSANLAMLVAMRRAFRG